MRRYAYVGPHAIAVRPALAGTPIRSRGELLAWLASNDEQLPDGSQPATFVVMRDHTLRLAPRRSEHVACAGGEDVLAAGEMFFLHAELVEVTNQSTGYCPEPESWPSVAAALDALGVPHPGQYTQEIIFRRCDACGQRNIVKDIWECGVCGATLPRHWNFAFVAPPDAHRHADGE